MTQKLPVILVSGRLVAADYKSSAYRCGCVGDVVVTYSEYGDDNRRGYYTPMAGK